MGVVSIIAFQCGFAIFSLNDRSVKFISAINRCKKTRKMLQKLIGLTIFAKTHFVFCVVSNYPWPWYEIQLCLAHRGGQLEPENVFLSLETCPAQYKITKK